MSEWSYARNGVQHGPLSAKQLKELVVSGRLQPTDEIGVGGIGRAPAGKISGLIYDVTRSGGMALLNIISPPQPKKLWSFDHLYPRMAIKFDGKLLGNISILKGFRFSLNIKPGRHTLSITVSRLLNLLHSSIPEKHYQLDLPQQLVYQIVFAYEWSGGVFKYQWRQSLDDAGALGQQWEVERQWWKCPKCGAEWAVELAGEELVNSEPGFRTIQQVDMVPNPNYGRLMPYGPHDYREHVPSYRCEQVHVITETWCKVLQCNTCKERWLGEKEIRCRA